jgi:hypothetical protein
MRGKLMDARRACCCDIGPCWTEVSFPSCEAGQPPSWHASVRTRWQVVAWSAEYHDWLMELGGLPPGAGHGIFGYALSADPAALTEAAIIARYGLAGHDQVGFGSVVQAFAVPVSPMIWARSFAARTDTSLGLANAPQMRATTDNANLIGAPGPHWTMLGDTVACQDPPPPGFTGTLVSSPTSIVWESIFTAAGGSPQSTRGSTTLSPQVLLADFIGDDSGFRCSDYPAAAAAPDGVAEFMARDPLRRPGCCG